MKLFLGAVAAVQASGKKATETKVWDEMQRMGVESSQPRESCIRQVRSHIVHYCGELWKKAGQQQAAGVGPSI